MDYLQQSGLKTSLEKMNKLLLSSLKSVLHPKLFLLCCWLDGKDIVYYEFLPQNLTLNSKTYCCQLDWWKAAIDEKHWNWSVGRLPSSIRLTPEQTSYGRLGKNWYSLSKIGTACCTHLTLFIWIIPYLNLYKILKMWRTSILLKVIKST